MNQIADSQTKKCLASITRETITAVASCVIALSTAVGTTSIGTQYLVAQAEEVEFTQGQVHNIAQEYCLLRADVNSSTVGLANMTYSNNQILDILNSLCGAFGDGSTVLI